MNPRNPLPKCFGEWQVLGDRIMASIRACPDKEPIHSDEVCALMLAALYPHALEAATAGVAVEFSKAFARAFARHPKWAGTVWQRIPQWWNAQSYPNRVKRFYFESPIYRRHTQRIVTKPEASNEQLRLEFQKVTRIKIRSESFVKIIQRMRQTDDLFISRELSRAIRHLKSTGQLPR